MYNIRGYLFDLLIDAVWLCLFIVFAFSGAIVGWVVFFFWGFSLLSGVVVDVAVHMLLFDESPQNVLVMPLGQWKQS